MTKLQRACLTCNDYVPTAINKWNSELSNVLQDDLSVQNVFKFCFSTINDSTVNWLQYFILHRILPVKYHLKKVNIITSECCTFSNEDSETIQHVFVKCKKMFTLRNGLSSFIYKRCHKRNVLMCVT